MTLLTQDEIATQSDKASEYTCFICGQEVEVKEMTNPENMMIKHHTKTYKDALKIIGKMVKKWETANDMHYTATRLHFLADKITRSATSLEGYEKKIIKKGG